MRLKKPEGDLEKLNVQLMGLIWSRAAYG